MRQPDSNHVTTRATYDAILLDLDGVTALVTISYTHMGNEAARGHPLPCWSLLFSSQR